jgi:thiaminase
MPLIITQGLYNHKCEEIPRKYFNGKTNRWNLNDAIKFIELINHFISNNINIDDVYIDDIEVSGKSNKNLHEKYHLPKYVNIYNYKGEFKGFMINGYPCEKYKSKKFKKVFSDPKLTLDENYNDCITFLNEFKINYPIVNNK